MDIISLLLWFGGIGIGIAGGLGLKILVEHKSIENKKMFEYEQTLYLHTLGWLVVLAGYKAVPFFRSVLTEKELHWLRRRSQRSSGIGIPEDVKNRIIELGYGEQEGLYSFKLTQKGMRYLESCMSSHSLFTNFSLAFGIGKYLGMNIAKNFIKG